MATPAPGLYVHVPFCAHRCGYCDFNVLVGASEGLVERYVAALRRELEVLAAQGPAAVAPPGAQVAATWPEIGSVFVGGGTPTQLEAAELAGVLRHVREVLPVTADAEVTVEANPEDLSEAYLAALVGAGLTRLSLGAQSWDAGVLRFLDRRHDPISATAAVGAARAAGVGSVSLDLIYGAPAESDESWQETLRTALVVEPDHVSCYALTLEANTPYAASVRSGTLGAPDDDVAARRMAIAEDLLAAAGYVRYEISNWARPGHVSRHNEAYWLGGDYLAVGAGAHGHWAGRRWWNTRPTERYVGQVEATGRAVAADEVLDRSQRRVERLLTGLRLSEGVARSAVEPIDEEAVRRLVADGLLMARDDRLQLTAEGRALADAITLQLLP